jgi:hypothetical protein
MFDNLRDDSSFYEEEPNDLYQEPTPAAQAQPIVATRRSSSHGRSVRFMGMTAQQRFLLSVMLLITVCVMGVLAMLVTGRMGF